jgi:hypothetical protein
MAAQTNPGILYIRYGTLPNLIKSPIKIVRDCKAGADHVKVRGIRNQQRHEEAKQQPAPVCVASNEFSKLSALMIVEDIPVPIHPAPKAYRKLLSNPGKPNRFPSEENNRILQAPQMISLTRFGTLFKPFEGGRKVFRLEFILESLEEARVGSDQVRTLWWRESSKHIAEGNLARPQKVEDAAPDLIFWVLRRLEEKEGPQALPGRVVRNSS